MRKLKLTKGLVHFLVVVSVLSTVLVVGHAHAATPKPAANPSTTTKSCQVHDFFGLQPWYQYLKLDPNTCEVQDFNLLPGNGKQSDLLLIVLALINDLLRVAGLVAVGFIIYAAVNFITSQGNADDAAKARGTAINALIGLLIAMVAIAFVSFIGNSLGG